MTTLTELLAAVDAQPGYNKKALRDARAAFDPARYLDLDDPATASVSGVTRWLRSESTCVCCTGQHVYSRGVETDNGVVYLSGWFYDALRRLPEGTRVRLSLAALREGSPT